MMTTPLSLAARPIHIGLGAKAVPQPEFSGEMEWYGAYDRRNVGDGAEGRLVSQHSFSESWDMWEMHPHGDEVVVCTAGRLILHQEQAGGGIETVTLEAGEYAINAPGVWHTADITGEATAIFVTAGKGTQHRPR